MRLCKELTVFIPLILLLVIFIGGMLVGNAPKYHTVFIFGLLILSWHLSRKDRTFLQTCFQRRYIGIYMLNYALCAIPFIAFFLAEKAIKESALLLILGVFVAFIPKKDLPFRLPTFLFLLKGSYIYQRMGRIVFPFYIVILIISGVGAYIHNENLVLVTNFIALSGIGMFLYIPVHKPYIFNYLNAKHLLILKCKQAFWNTGIVLFPLLLCLLLVNSSWNRLGMCALSYLNGTLFLLQMDLLRFLCGDDSVLFTIVYMALLFVVMLSIIIPPFTVLSLTITIALAFYVQSSLKRYLS